MISRGSRLRLGASAGVATSSIIRATPAVLTLFFLSALFAYAPPTGFAASYGAASWGPNGGGELGVGTLEGPEKCIGTTLCSTIAAELELTGISEEVVAVAAGNSHSLALLKDGKVLAWGFEQFGDLGNGSERGAFPVPKEVTGLSEVTAIATNGPFDLALLKNGTVKAWGNNSEGELGIGTESSEVREPTTVSGLSETVSGLSEVTAIATGIDFSLALLKNGTVKGWGANGLGELTLGESVVDSDVPVSISGLTEVTAIAAGAESAYALLKNGTVKAWGSNYDGMLGDGSFTGPETCFASPCSRSPISVSGLSEVTAVSSSYEHVLALTKGGTVKSWGENSEGELGDGTIENRDAPVAVSKLSGVTAVAGGLFQSLALLSNGTVEAWGDNEYGQLGIGTYTGPEECGPKHFPCSTTPVAVHGLAGVKGISANGISLAYGLSATAPKPAPEELLGPENPGEPSLEWGCTEAYEEWGCTEEEPVNSATGNESLQQTDASIGGRGLGLKVTRTYNDQAAVTQSSPGRFGYGWSSSFSDRVVVNAEQKILTVVQTNGSAVIFTGTPGTVGEFSAPAQAEAKLSFNGEKIYVYTLPTQEVFDFNEEGRLVSETDRNGNSTSLSYNGLGQLETVTDPAGRKLTFAYNSEGEVESVKDPMGHTVKYTYEGGNLASVTLPGESKANWQFKYDASHRLTSVTDGREGKTTIEYDSANRVVSETDPAGRKRKYVYEPFETTVTNEATGAMTREIFTEGHERELVTRGFGTASATSERFSYDGKGDMLSQTNGDGQTTTYTYNAAGDKMSMTRPDKNETKWTYDGTHDVLTVTTPKGETTTTERDSRGNPVKVSRLAPGETTQVTKYTYDSHGEMESMTDPLERTWKYEYDSYGDRVAEVDPVGDKRTWAYDEDSQQTSTVSPRGNLTGAVALEYTTTTERDAQGRPMVVSEPQANVGRPVNRVRSSISGVTLEGQTLTAAPGVWEGAPTLTYTYRWERCNSTGGSCAAISGATASTYVLGSADVGHTLRVVVTTTNSSGSASSTAAVTAVVSVVTMPRYGAQFGSAGSGAGQLSSPYGVTLDSHGNVWVADRGNNRLDELTSAGVFVETVGWGVSNGEAKLEVCTSGCRAGIAGSGEGQFDEPTAVAFSGGNMYIADFVNDRVQELNEKTEFVRAFGERGSGAGQLVAPIMVAVGAGGNVWVSDAENDRVDEFTSTGTFVETIGWGVSNGESKYEICTSGCRAGLAGAGEGQLELPIGIAFYGGTMYVADYGNDRVEEFDEESKYVTKFGSRGTGPGQFEEVTTLTVESAGGHIYVDDWGDNRVEEFTSAGAYVGQFGSIGSGNGQFHGPQGIAITSSGSLYVADETNDRIEEWKPVSTPVNIAAPSVSGEIVTGQTLTAGTGIWSASPAATYTYQWQRCNSAGGGCANVTGATGSTYTLGSGDTGYRLRAMVKATNTAGSTEVASAAAERTAGPHTTEYAYDGDGNVVRVTDPNGHATHYVYDADNERTKVEESNGTVTETSYDGAGQVTSQMDGNKHTTKYVRNVLEQVTEVVDPLLRKTTKEYDAAGNTKSVTDAAGRTTTYTYDPANRLTEVGYSDGKTPTVKYEYDGDGNRTKMTDGTGTNTYVYDQLDRLTEGKDGHGDVVKYTYDLANEQTKIVYPNGKTVERAYDKAGRLEKVTDWLEHTTKFSYNADSGLTAMAFPTGTSEEDTYAYNNADQMTEAKMSKGAETLASLVYARDNNGQVQRSVGKGLPGKETLEYAYDENNRMAKGAGAAYAYDAANAPTTIAGSATYKYDSASQLETGPSLKYTYNEVGERTKTMPTTGPATTYGYDQAGNLTTVERPEEGSTPKIEDSYAYNGDGLRASETIGATTHYLAWDTSEGLPLVLSDGTDSYVYGPGNVPIEQINNEEKPQYLHHDQQSSTRLITSVTGTVEGSYTYTPYGGVETHTGTAITALGYDGQYTSSDTGLIYLRARVYDPSTAQFLSVDPAVESTRAPYSYALDNPLDLGDPTGLTPWSPKVKEAVAKCRSWKAWHSKKSPFYGNRVIYEACQDLLRLPPEVFGTGREAESHTGLRITAGVAGATAVAFGVGSFVACEGATDAIGTAHCAHAILPSVQVGIVALGYAIFGK